MDLLGQSALLVGLTSFALGFSVLARNVRNGLYIAFAILCTLISFWALAFGLEKIFGGGDFYRLHLFFNLWLAPASLGFIRVLVRVRDPFSRRLTTLGVLAAVALSTCLGLGLQENFWILQAIYFLPALVLVQTLYLMWIDRRLRRGVKLIPKRPTVGFARRNLIYIGGLFVLCLSVMDHVPFLMGASGTLPSLGNLGLIAYLFFISRAITQQRLLNLGALISRFIVLCAVAATLTGVFTILVAWIENSPSLFFLNSFIASFLILMLLDPLRALVAYSTERLLSKRYQGLQATLREATGKLSGITDPGALFQTVLSTIEKTLEPEWAALFILRRDGTRFRRVRTIGTEQRAPGTSEEQPLVREILAENELLRFAASLRRRGELPIILEPMLESEMERTTSRAQREAYAALRQSLRALGGNILLPLVEGSQSLGFVVVRAWSAPEPWGNNWGLLQVIAPYFEQAARVLRNLDVYVRQREKERLATLGEMAAGLAHEIRNPLGAIKGAAQFLDPESQRSDAKFLKIIIEEADRLNQVVTSFLDYSRPHPVQSLESIELESLVERSLETIRTTLPPSITLDLHVSPRARQARAQVIPSQIQQVLLNLVQNSINALNAADLQRPGRIRVSLDQEDVGQLPEILVTVEDNGPGIPRESLDRIFIPFFTTSPGGTGLGLPISQKIVENHQGRIEVQSEPGRYARFTISLPALPSSETSPLPSDSRKETPRK
jgi:two-component system sensor histidine kinase HydH